MTKKRLEEKIEKTKQVWDEITLKEMIDRSNKAYNDIIDILFDSGLPLVLMLGVIEEVEYGLLYTMSKIVEEMNNG